MRRVKGYRRRVLERPRHGCAATGCAMSAVNVTLAYRRDVHSRQNYDFRLWAPWTPEVLATLGKSAGAAWANPAHPASEGRRAAVWLEALEATVAGFFGGGHVRFFPDREVALAHVVAEYRGQRIATAATNRRSVLPLASIHCDVDERGQAEWVDADVVLLQYGNEETGVIDHYAGSAVRVLDASNALGRVPISAAWDYLIGSARAWGAPVDVAFVVSIRELVPSAALSLPLVAVAVNVLEQHWGASESHALRTERAINDFESSLTATVPDVQFHGDHRVPHMRSFSVLHLDAETLTRELDAAGYVLGSGSACVNDGTPSHVLSAMGVITHGNLRLALPIDADLESLPGFVDVLATTIARLRREAGVDDL